jgi:hypothetical protein
MTPPRKAPVKDTKQEVYVEEDSCLSPLSESLDYSPFMALEFGNTQDGDGVKQTVILHESLLEGIKTLISIHGGGTVSEWINGAVDDALRSWQKTLR